MDGPANAARTSGVVAKNIDAGIGGGLMRILVATDAWHPQINGVVRTLTTLAKAVRNRGASIEFLTPEGFPSFPLPTYPGMRCAITNSREIARRVEAIAPDAIHIATEGPVGWAVRRYCLKRKLPFTTSYTTKFPEYISARVPIPESWSYAVLRNFHNASAVTMVSTNSLTQDLESHGFTNIGMWTRGVDTDLFSPDRAIDLKLPRPIFMTLGRVAVEKNLDAFLSLDLPGSKAIIGRGPEEARLKRQYPNTTFFGSLSDENLASHLAAADVFVFPSRTDTYGVVQLEALACGVPVAAFPVTGPIDVIAGNGIGALNNDLRVACLEALTISRQACRDFALARSWDNSAKQFLGNVSKVVTDTFSASRAA
jgi:glycosyltransferase involved in cell wall biosynthesis